MRRYFQLFLICFIISQSLKGQQISPLNDYSYFYSSSEFYSKFIINAAYTGNKEQHEFHLNSFNQFVGLGNALSAYTFAYNGSFNSCKSGIGACANFESYSDVDQRREISGYYSFGIIKSPNFNISAGTKLGVAARKIDSKYVLFDAKMLQGSGTWINSPLMDLGLNLKYEQLDIGITAKNLINSNLKIQGYETSLYVNGIITNVSYDLMPFENLILTPYFFDYYIKENSISFGLMSEINNKYFAAIGYNSFYEKINATISIKFLKHFQLGYIYEKYSDFGFNGFTLKASFKSDNQQ